MDYGLRRIKRKETYEEWLINCTMDDKIVRTDVVVILFKKEKTDLYLVTNNEDISQEEEYIMDIINLVHDLDEECFFTFRIVSDDKILEEVSKIEDMIN